MRCSLLADCARRRPPKLGDSLFDEVGSEPSHSLTVNISGPGQTVYNADGSQTITFLGNGAIFLADQIMLNSGRVVVIAPDALSVGYVVLAAGNQRNLFTMLAWTEGTGRIG